MVVEFESFYIKQGDTLPIIKATLTDAAGVPIDLTGTTVRLLTAWGLSAVAAFTNPPGVDGKIQYAWAVGNTDAPPGIYNGEFEVDWGGGAKQTVPNDSHIKIHIVEDLG